MPVTDDHRPTARRRETARGAPRRGSRPRADADEEPAPAVQDDLRAPTDQVLPPGWRDDSGFWIPEGYEEPEALFSPHQRHLQEKQRQAHRARRQRDGEPRGGGARVDSPEPSE